jgi:hypothetical protein
VKDATFYTYMHTRTIYIQVKTEEYIVRDVTVIVEVKPNFYKIGTEYTTVNTLNVRDFLKIY